MTWTILIVREPGQSPRRLRIRRWAPWSLLVLLLIAAALGLAAGRFM